MVPIHEEATGRRFRVKADQYFKRYKPYIESLESRSLLSRIRPITPYDIYALGAQLESWDIIRSMCEADGSLNMLGKIPDVAMDVITVTYGTSPLSIIASTQPIEEERGSVYFKDVIAQNTRGTVTSGHAVARPDAIEQDVLDGFAGDSVLGITHTAFTTASTLTYTVTPAALAALVPLRKYKAVVHATSLNDGFDLFGDGKIASTDFTGTIDYATGAVTIVFIADPGGNGSSTGKAITIDASQDFEGSTNIPQIQAQFRSKPIAARIWALKSVVGLEQSYALRKRFGLVAEDEIANDLVTAINMEMMNVAIKLLIAKIPGGIAGSNNVTFVRSAGTSPGYAYFEHKQEFKDKLRQAEAKMVANAGRGTISVMICGLNPAALVSTLSGFEKLTDGAQMGPHIYGTLDGITIVRVPNTNILNVDQTLVLYKGPSPFEAALVYAPYMPLVTTGMLPMSPNPLLQQRAVCVWAGLESLIPNFIAGVKLVDP